MPVTRTENKAVDQLVCRSQSCLPLITSFFPAWHYLGPDCRSQSVWVKHTSMILLQLSFLLILLVKCSSAQEKQNPREALSASVADLTMKMYNSLAAQGNQENFVFSPLR